MARANPADGVNIVPSNELWAAVLQSQDLHNDIKRSVETGSNILMRIKELEVEYAILHAQMKLFQFELKEMAVTSESGADNI